MAEPGLSPLSRSPSSSRPPARPGTPSRDSCRGPPPLPASPSKSPPKSSPLKSSYLGLDSQHLTQRITGNYLPSGTYHERPAEISNSNLTSNVAADSSSIAALDAKVNQENLKQEIMPSSAGLEARVALEQTAAAAKYGAHTGSASDGADVRWYFCKTPLRPNEAAAQVPASEVVGKGEYFRFSLRDSLSLEASFVQREGELLSAWWKEYAEVSAGPTKSSGTLPSTLQIEKGSTEEKFGSLSSASDGRTGQKGPGSTNSDFDDDEESVGVLVKGGLYEVDLMRRRCIPVYWRGERRRVLRGHWYVRKGGLDWLPLREDVAEQLEIAYHKKIWRRRQFQPSGLYAARVNLTGTTMGLHALFTGEDDNWEATLAVDASGISAILGFQGSGVKLRRGFAPPDSEKTTQDELRQRKEEELDDYASQVPVRHVVFMVHGIGQRLEKANLVDDVDTFRQTVTALSELHLTPHQRKQQRILFIPCQWRRELKLGGEVAMEQVTLDGVRTLRTMISSTVHDVLYYMSPVYCQDIIDSVTRSLNRLYTRFIKRNPSFDGKVSLYGHSLGSVLTYDILCHQDTLKSPFPVQSINAAITRNDDCEDDMPKIARLPSSLENEFIPEGGTSVQDPLSSANNPKESSDIISTAISENELIPEVEAAESEDATAAEDVALEPHKIGNIAVSIEDTDVLLRNIFTSKVGDILEDEITKEHTEISEDAGVTKSHLEIPEETGVAKSHSEISEETDVAKSHPEISEETNVAKSHPEISEETGVAKSHSEISDEDDLVKEDTEILMQDDDTVEYTQTLHEHDIAQEHADASEEFQALEIKNSGNENEDAGVDSNIIGRESLQDLEGSNFENYISDAAQNARLQDTEQEAVQDMAGVEIKKVLDDFDQVMVNSVEDNEEIPEIDRLKAKLSALQEKLRLMDIDSGNVKGKLEPTISARKQHRPFIIYPKLKFKVETFYAVGSPLGMFLALRNIRIGLGTGTEYWQDEGIDEEMPACRLLLNIFHPYDPVAYRLEPLVCKEFVDQKPVFIPYHKGGKRIHIGLQEFGEDISMKSKAFVNSISAVGTRVAYACTSKKDESLREEEEKERNRKKPKTYGQMVMERLTGSAEGRIDCMLQDATFEHQYISAISSHTSYWQDPDTALFILRHLYRDIPEEPESEDVTTMEAIDETIDGSIATVNSSPVVSAQDDWDSGDDDSSSLFFSKEDFVALLETDQAKPTPNQKV